MQADSCSEEEEEKKKMNLLKVSQHWQTRVKKNSQSLKGSGTQPGFLHGDNSKVELSLFALILQLIL